VEPDFDEGLPPVLVDPDMAHQVVLNLMINAIQAMPDGGTLRVSTGLRRTRSTKVYVDVIVTDSGPGIPEDVKEKIFDPFFTTRSMGTGLGLSISLQIAREHGGNLTARNLTQGAAFRFSLPAMVAGTATVAPAAGAGAAGGDKAAAAAEKAGANGDAESPREEREK
jgi:signal transduction histidine kinase